jgi:hypothetical protein
VHELLHFNVLLLPVPDSVPDSVPNKVSNNSSDHSSDHSSDNDMLCRDHDYL